MESPFGTLLFPVGPVPLAMIPSSVEFGSH
jgi:hypothetical protein